MQLQGNKTMNAEQKSKKISQIVAKSWADEAFKKKLLADPAGTLKAEGVDLPAGMKVHAVENTSKVFNLVLPAKPTTLSDADLEKVAGGALCISGGISGPGGIGGGFSMCVSTCW
jgi:hypothetical protein